MEYGLRRTPPAIDPAPVHLHLDHDRRVHKVAGSVPLPRTNRSSGDSPPTARHLPQVWPSPNAALRPRYTLHGKGGAGDGRQAGDHDHHDPGLPPSVESGRTVQPRPWTRPECPRWSGNDQLGGARTGSTNRRQDHTTSGNEVLPLRAGPGKEAAPGPESMADAGLGERREGWGSWEVGRTSGEEHEGVPPVKGEVLQGKGKGVPTRHQGLPIYPGPRAGDLEQVQGNVLDLPLGSRGADLGANLPDQEHRRDQPPPQPAGGISR